MDVTIDSTILLGTGARIPRFGLGVFRAGPGAATVDAVRAALAHGYRHVDTARVYKNEREVGEALRASGVPREDVFVTTKLWNDDQGYDETLAACAASLDALGLEAVDLYLMHWPVPGKRRESWRAMEQLFHDGKARAIGVSNFMPHHLDELMGYATVKPAVNQFELHPWGQQRAAVEWCRAHDVVVEAYSPLAKGHKLADPTVAAIARACGRTPAQVLIRWSLQRGFVVIPKSANPARIVENATVFDFALDDAQMASLDALEEGLHTAWDPTHAP